MTTTVLLTVVYLSAWLSGLHSQGLVSIEFQKAPVLATAGQPAIFTIVTVANIFSTTWTAPDGGVIGTWTSAGAAVNEDYKNRVTLTVSQLQITVAELRDAGNYSVTVAPSDTTGLNPNTRSVELKVFVAVTGVSLSVLPSVPVEGRNLTVRCTFSAGTQISVAWGKGDTALVSGDRLTISGGTLMINPARRDDTGQYSCTVSNAVSVETARISLTVYYGPDTPTLTKESAECVGGGDAVIGQAMQITCVSESLPPATFTWQHNNNAVSSSQSSTGSLSLQISSTDQSGDYTCVAQNTITGGSSRQETTVSVVGTCLSGGAVAGIVIACFVAILIIIIIIIVLLRQRTMDKRIRNAINLQKTTQDPVMLPPLGNVRAETLPEPPLHTFNPHESNNHQTSLPNGHANNLPQNGLNNNNANNAAQQNGYQHNGTAPQTGNSRNMNGIGNGYGGHLHNDLHPQASQQNPNVLLQAGQTQSGALQPTVHVNLNTVPNADQRNGNSQPQTVNVNLNTFPPPSSGHQLANNVNNAPQINAVQHNELDAVLRPTYDQNTNQDNLIQTGHSHVNPAFQSDEPETWILPQESSAMQRHLPNTRYNNRDGDQVPPSHRGARNHSSHRDTGRQDAANYNARQSDQSRGRSQSRDNHTNDSHELGGLVEPDIRRSQRPWDTLRGTPAYPNQQTSPRDTSSSNSQSSSTSSSYYSERHSESPQRTPPRGQSSQAPRSARREARREETVPQGRERSRDRRREEVLEHGADLSLGYMDPNTERYRQRARQAFGDQPQNQTPQRRQAASNGQFIGDNSPRQGAGAIAQHSSGQQMAAIPQGMATQPQSRLPPPYGGQARQFHQSATEPRAIPRSSHPPPYGAQISQTDRQLSTRTQVQPNIGPEQTQPAQQGTGAQRANGTAQNPNPLTQATLQHHTRHTHNPFSNRNQQTQAALQHPGTQVSRQQQQQSRTQPTQPTQQPPAAAATTQNANGASRRPPTPPPVLQPSQFQALPKERLQQRQPRVATRGPLPHTMPSHPVVRHHGHAPPMGHRPPGDPVVHRQPRQTMPLNPHRATGHAHLHANLQRHAIGHRPPPPHTRQVHRSRPRRS